VEKLIKNAKIRSQKLSLKMANLDGPK